jgi:hypothetical protein
MKICPQCRSKYTDDSLQFCLQDGSSLKSAGDERTLVMNQETFSDDQKVVGNNAVTSSNEPHRTGAFSNQQTDQTQTLESDSIATVIRSHPPVFDNSGRVSPKKEPNKSGFGFLLGFVIGVLLLGIIGAGILGIIFLPSIIERNSISNVSVSEKNKKTKIISDSSLIKVSASSTRNPEKGNFYNPELAFDGNSRTAWAEGAKGAGIGQWIVFVFFLEVRLKEIIIEPGYFKTPELWRKNNRLAEIILTFSDRSKQSYGFKDLMKEQKFDVGNVKTESVMITIRDIYPGQTDSKDTLISEVRFVVEE